MQAARAKATAPNTQAMEADVMQMEARLKALRTTMAGEREKRDAQRARNPSGSVWRSARTDAPVNSAAYAEGVLRAKPPPGAAPPRRRGSRDAAASAVGDGDAANRGAVQPLMSAAAAEATAKGATGQPFGKTKSALFEWNPAASVGEGGDAYEDLLGPEGGPRPAPPPPAARQAAPSDSGVGGSLLHGSFDEDESSESFAEALRAWRGEPAPASTRKPRFVAQPPPEPKVAEPTLADKVGALKTELNLPADGSLVDTIRAANAMVGLQCIGSLADQVGRLLRETGIKPVASSKAEGGSPKAAAMAPPSPSGGRPSSGSSRPASASRGMSCQTQPSTTFYERFLEQKRKDEAREAAKAAEARE